MLGHMHQCIVLQAPALEMASDLAFDIEWRSIAAITSLIRSQMVYPSALNTSLFWRNDGRTLHGEIVCE